MRLERRDEAQMPLVVQGRNNLSLTEFVEIFDGPNIIKHAVGWLRCVF